MFEYERKINYYETDKMGIVHHSNYVRFMEEARVAFLDSIGCGYEKFEADGIVSPVVSVNCRYKRPLRFGDIITVFVSVKSYNGIGLTLEYEIRKKGDDSIAFSGTSEHCFTNADMGIVRVKNAMPDIHALFMESMQNN